jgi:hypothetical protein
MSGQGILQQAGQLALETELALANSRVVIVLSAENPQFDQIELFQRRYLLGHCSDGSEGLFLTTNEVPDDPFTHVPLGAHFTVLNGFDGLIEELQANSPVCYFEQSVHSLPKYVYYDIDLMDDRFKPLFRAHLEGELDGLAADYIEKHFTSKDRQRIEYLRKFLNAHTK